MRFPYPFRTVSLSGGKLVRAKDDAIGFEEFTVDDVDGTALLHLHLSKKDAAQWAAVLTEYAESAP